ncbi:hypothetical protein Airi02_090160 [Actinoallomurus iriomotensis]|uniref:Uncharacterized protein n=1 Tax=Actinoallomurus iriomotensis TaxID=478107 RepID=A0A9W6W5K7_9ACTN|nr:hypothetical protein Airi02_090160 [Actinoallomurus iriomotensis]
MSIRKHVTLTAAGLVIAGGTALLGGPAGAAARAEAAAVTPVTSGEQAPTLRPPRCRTYVRGRYERRRVRGRVRRVWIAGHWLPRGCRR